MLATTVRTLCNDVVMVWGCGQCVRVMDDISSGGVAVHEYLHPSSVRRALV